MKKLSRLVSLVVLLLLPSVSRAQDTLGVVFWNLENFFDWKDGGQGDSDGEFSANGSRHWTKSRFFAKCSAVAKTVLWSADGKGRLPDVFGVAEVENEEVVRRLIDNTLLRKFGYSYVHFDSPDPRGIDVALLYRRDRLTLLNADTVRVAGFSTRDILYAQFRTGGGKVFSCIVNHHPSKYGGKASAPRRIAVMESMLALADSLGSCGPVIAMGDFNDTPDGEAPAMASSHLKNLALPLHARGQGTIKFDGRWELIDMFFAGGGLETGHMEILSPPFLLTEDKAHSGVKPLRTWSGPRWNGGVSDHLPIAVDIYL